MELLADLDSLALSVREPQSRVYIREAIDAYRAGACRAAIVAAWTAVVFDLLQKLRELAELGEGACVVLVEEWDRAVRNGLTANLLKIEDSLLDRAHKDFELLGVREHQELQRLQGDRHLCAHPAFVREGVLFDPSPELVRSHIVHSITHLLRNAPVQGKTVLLRLKADLLSQSFPSSPEGVLRFMKDKYLSAAKPSVIDSLITVLLKALLRHTEPDLRERNMALVLCLVAISRTHGAQYAREMADRLPRLTAALDDLGVASLMLLLCHDPQVWHWTAPSGQEQVRAIIENKDLLKKHWWLAFGLLGVVPLKDTLMAAFRAATPSEQSGTIAVYPREEFIPFAIQIYREAGDFRSAEAAGKSAILPMAGFFTGSDVASAVRAARENGQVYYANETPEILVRLFELTQDRLQETKEEWVKFMQEMLRISKPDDHYGYPRLRELMEKAGIWPPPKKEAQQAPPSGLPELDA